MEYIQPDLKSHKSLVDLLEDETSTNPFLSSFSAKSSMKDIIEEPKNILLVGEPGYGKTRFLKELILRGEKSGIFIDLKQIGRQKIGQYIQSQNFSEIKDNKNKLFKELKAFKTIDFNSIKFEGSIFCFDALDEVRHEDFSLVVQNLKEFIESNEKSNIIISCRKNYLEKWKHLFSEFSMGYFEVLPLNHSKVESFLHSFGMQTSYIKQLIHKMSFEGRQGILKTPRYLEMVGDIVREGGINRLKDMNRCDLFEAFIYKKFDLENEKTDDIKNREITKKVLEKLALVMEIYQTNKITKDELMEFFDDIESNLSISFLNQVPINSFYERSLLKDSIDSIEFENTEFQEYLAAKEIFRLGRTDQVIFDLAFMAKAEEVHPTWINTLSFVIEKDITLLKTIFGYIFSSQNKVQIESCIKLLTREGVEKISLEDRRIIFRMVFSYYQEFGQWIDYDVAEKLSFYYDEGLSQDLKGYVENKKIKGDRKHVVNANCITLMGYLLERNKLKSIEKFEYWKKKIKTILNKKGQNEVVLRRALFALGKFEDLSLFDDVIEKMFARNEDAIITSLIYALQEIDPNDPIVFESLLKGAKRKNIPARNAFSKITKKSSIEAVLAHFVKDEDLLFEFIDSESIYGDVDSIFIENIKKGITAKSIEYMEQILFIPFLQREWYKAEKSKFLEEIALILDQFSKDFLFKFLEKVLKMGKFYHCNSLLSTLVKKENAERFIKSCQKKGVSPKDIFRVLLLIKSSGKSGADEIYKLGRKYLSDQYDKAEDFQVRFKEGEEEKRKALYREFLSRLQPSKGMYDLNVFRFYLENKDQLADLIKQKEKNRLLELIKSSIFDVFDPGQQELRIKEKKGTSTTYATHQFISIFGACLKIAREFDAQDFSSYRQKILNYVPFAYHEHLEAIFALVPNPSASELEQVLRIYKNRKDDLLLFSPSRTISFLVHYKVEEGLELLRFFVESSEMHNRKSALEAVAFLGGKKDYFDTIFQLYQADPNHQPLAEKANEILISQFKDESAIDWRISELVRRNFPFNRDKDLHRIARTENEIYDKKFADPLIQLKDSRYKEKFLKLLKESFKIYKKKGDFYEYASYLWGVVLDFFDGLKEYRIYSDLDEISKFILENSDSKGMNWFIARFQGLKTEFLRYIGKPQNISDCIKAYNDFKRKKYLLVTTPRDLVELIKDILDKDMKNWIENEGAYKMIETYRPTGKLKFQKEDLIQKTIKTQFENCLLKAGLRKEEIHIQREVQLLDDKRPDFFISYGFVGPVIVELKLTQNDEVKSPKKSKEYSKKMIQYIKGTASHHGFLVVFQIDEKNKVEGCLEKLEKLYRSEKSIMVRGFNCLKNI